MKMIAAILAVSSIFLTDISEPSPYDNSSDSLLVMFWNLENFFDPDCDSERDADVEFSAGGERKWTFSRFWKKIQGISKTIFRIGDDYGKIPDIIGFAEVENRTAVDMLLDMTLLRKLGYVQIHYDSPDPRGIDVSLLYRKSKFNLISSSAFPIKEDVSGGSMRTRDILLVILECACSGDTVAVTVNHHPSKFGGEKKSEPRRQAAVRRLAALCDSLIISGNSKVICMGDFNDNPESGIFSILGKNLLNKSESLYEKGRGTIRFEGKWDLIDMFFVSEALGHMKMDIFMPEFLLEKDGRHSGYKPFRTYMGPVYNGGISDHLPIVLYGKHL